MNKLKCLFIVLGQSCNLNCIYCMQDKLQENNRATRNDLNKEVSDKTLSFIDKCLIDRKDSLKIVFFGGEPLLYYNQIKTIVDKYKNAKCFFTIITNGSLLNKEMIKYFNDNKVTVVISWDGKEVLSTRHYDVLKEKKELIFNIENLCISGVLSAYNYIEDFLESCANFNEEYYNYSNRHIGVACDLIYIYDKSPESLKLIDIDYNKLNKQIKNICDNLPRIISNYNDPRNTVYLSLIRGRLFPIINNKKVTKEAPCGRGKSMFNIDLDGNLYFCHNNLEQVTGSYLDSYETIAANADKYIKYIHKDCNTCKSYPVCLKACPLLDSWQRDFYLCKFTKAIYEPIIDKIIKIKKAIDLD